MAQLVLSQAGGALGARFAPAAFRAIGQTIRQAIGASIGARIDDGIFGPIRRIEGPRLTDIHLQGSTEGASIPVLYGRVRIAGQVLWAARFKEHSETTSTRTSGKGGGGKTKITSYRYSLSFAVGLCEGEIARIGRVWANGEAFDLSSVAYRLYRGTEDQEPDALIEAIEGAENAPAYRGLAYIVFEDLPLENFGNIVPQLSFEIVRPAARDDARLENMVHGVCMIPGAGEFVYATTPVRRVIGPGEEVAENVHAEQDRANFLVSLDQLQADLPACDFVMLVVAWFGDDLRIGECQIKPGVEIASKETRSIVWRAGGVTRSGAHVVSTVDDAPAFGGTPADETVLQAIAEIKTRGLKVGLYPLLLMDIPTGNALPDPHGGEEQAAYPWRGRVALDPDDDQTPAASLAVDAFFGAAAPSDFTDSGTHASYSGPAEWSFRRFILHYAKLAEMAGGIDAFVMGSELRGLTIARDSADHFPAVDALVALAEDVRALIGDDAALTYGADWSEYFGHQPADASGDVFFHLDPLWASDAISCVGVDWYPPLSDWRDGQAHLDAQLARTPHDPSYLASRIEGGENYDWYYASAEDRDAQTRTPITDGAYSEPNVFRAKDVRAFWANAHHNRPSGVRDASPTAWIPRSKPIWLTELGCPAIDKGANQPNAFVDPKSSESALPFYSSGSRDDLIQRRTLEAYLGYWADEENNPTAELYDGRMIENTFVWCWDARPHPAFPARADVWSDGASWRIGHWLSGRAGLATLGDVVSDLCARAGADEADVAHLSGIVTGYVVDSPSSARGALEPLMAAYGFHAREQNGALVFAHDYAGDPIELTLSDLTEDSVSAPFRVRADVADAPVEARVRYLDASRDYLVGAASARRRDAAETGVVMVDAPLVMEAEGAEILAERVLALARAGAESAAIAVGPAQLALEPGDQIALSGLTFDITRIEDGRERALDLTRALEAFAPALSGAEPNAPPTPPLASMPAFAFLDLPPLTGTEDDERPLIAISASPWLGAHRIYVGDTERALANEPAIMGKLTSTLGAGCVDRWDEANSVEIQLYGGGLESVDEDALLSGANVFAIESANDEWELLQAREAVQIGPRAYRLSGLLRGLLGSGHAMRAPAPIGAKIVKLDTRLARMNIGAHEWGAGLTLIAPPFATAPRDANAAQLTVTPPHAWARPFAPAHPRAHRGTGGDVTVSWIRQARRGGDFWGAGEVGLGETGEAYLVEVLDGAGTVLRAITVTTPSALYSAADQTADFGAPPTSLRMRVGQIGDNGIPGLKIESTITL